ncbi:hypothetical protein VE03_00709 [Pseudogymnoascus sp. 23342-1-I1]|nr:hypothetical protein VE03_00709 [Pseudogymnoascus sp. 23342-1-I1]
MARLNEAPAPADPVELLRRKYTRQNKDIARVNSIQAVRIRNLETEVSRLLAENLDLRGQIVTQGTQPDRSRNFISHVGDVKSELDSKLRDIAALVAKLDRPVKETRRSSAGTKLPKAQRRNSEERMQMMDELAEQGGRLPPIIENKHYPRRTLDAQEITAIISDPIPEISDSPDIGPPPVSHFMNEDPVKIDLPTRSKTDAEEVSDFGPTLPVNLEQRRKRKDMSGMLDHDQSTKNDTAPVEKKESVQQPLKSGAKRKFDVCDDIEDEREARPVSIAPEESRHTRRAAIDKSQSSKESTPAEKPVARIQREVALARAKTRDKAASNARASTPLAASGAPRKALGPKTSNTDVANSPKKLSKPPMGDDSSLLEKIGGTKGRERPRSRNEPRIVIPAQVDPVVAMPSIETIPEPETPAALEDLFSPTSSAPSTARQISRDTPPPQEIGQGGEGHRPSRRARASVNYAEPNLRDKMRRPAEGQIDAVTGEGKYRRASCVPAEDEPPTVVKIKPEPGTGDDASWKSKLPTASSSSVYSTSPLSGKMADATPIQEIPQRKRRSSQLHTNSGDEEAKSGSGAAISALMSDNRKAKPELSDRDPVASAFKKMEKRMADLDIYEFSGSPPREARSRAGRNNEDPQKQRVSRSQSATDMLDLTTAGRQSTRRRQSTLGVGIGDAAAAKMEEYKNGEKASQRPTSLQMPKEGEGLERLGARRRSMML